MSQIAEKPGIVNFFFPPFSEKELVSLFYLLFLSAIHHWELIISTAFMSIKLFFFFIGVALAMIMVFFHAISYSQALKVEKQFFAFSFYLLLSIITIYSMHDASTNMSINAGNSILSILEFLIFLFIFLKSVARLILMRYAREQIMEDMGNQMKDHQTRAADLILIILFAPVIYLLIYPQNTPAQTICLSYFYLSLVIKNSNKAISRYLATR